MVDKYSDELLTEAKKKAEAKKKLEARIDGYNFDGRFRKIKTNFGKRMLVLHCYCERNIWNIKKTELLNINIKGDEIWECGECKQNWLVKKKNIDRLYNHKEEPKWTMHGNLGAKPLKGFFSKIINGGRFYW